MRIFHIASAADWQRARRDGAYRVSTRGRTLEQEGFIHASRDDQVLATAEAFYADADEPLVVLVVDEDRLTSEVRREVPPGGDDAFPHVYGPIDVDAVVAVLPLERGADGAFTLDL